MREIDADYERLRDPQDEPEGIVYTAGLSSTVLDGDDVVGHTLLLDLDGVEQDDVREAAQQADGVRAVFESSPGSYHLWILSVEDFEQAILSGLSWQVADAEHVKQSYRRGRYVLRIVGKVREDGSTYKEAPALKAVYADEEIEESVSRPHLRWIEQAADEQDLDISDELERIDEDDLVGSEDGLIMDRYMTIDDETKEALK
jgi:hypothetical protein